MSAEIIPVNLLRIMPAKGNDHHFGAADVQNIRTMKKFILILLTTSILKGLFAQTPAVAGDSDFCNLAGVVIRQVSNSTGTSNANVIQAVDLKLLNSGRDIPVLLQSLTNAVTTSDAGNGIGYTGIRIRGTDASRTNITINGVPINDAESQGTFWVNMPDLASSAKSLYIQRGLSNSTTGPGSFGASINVNTLKDLGVYPENNISLSYGSFNTIKFSAVLESHEIPTKWGSFSTSGRLSYLNSDGFVNHSNSNLMGYQYAARLVGKTRRLELLIFGGREKTQQAWWGIPIEKFKMGDPQLSQNELDSQKVLLQNHYLRNAGIGYTYQNSNDSANLFNSKPNQYNYYLYPNETDNYQQHHAHVYYIQKLSSRSSLNTTLYYTHGEGYYQQFRYADKLSKYGLPNIVSGDTGVSLALSNSNLYRQRWLNNDLLGFNAYWNYNQISSLGHQYLMIGFGGSQYWGHHYGIVTDVELATPKYTRENIPHEYYRGIGNKTDLNAFVKYSLQRLSRNPHSLFVDVQVRKVKHYGRGMDNDLRTINFEGNFLFINPKAGFSLVFSDFPGVILGSVGLVGHEPSRSDWVDRSDGTEPKAEYLTDYELGYQWKQKIQNPLFVNINAYYMNYKNQLILTGAVNDVGTPLRMNVAKSFRRGIELETGKQWHWDGPNNFSKHFLQLEGNLSLSQNIIPVSNISWMDYLTYTSKDTTYQNAPIAYSPNAVGALKLMYSFKFGLGFSHELGASWTTKFVSQQYLDNTGDKSRTLGAYNFSEAAVFYKIRQGKYSYSPTVTFQLQIFNILNQYFANNAYTWGYFYGQQFTQEVFVFPTALQNGLFSINYKF